MYQYTYDIFTHIQTKEGENMFQYVHTNIIAEDANKLIEFINKYFIVKASTKHVT